MNDVDPLLTAASSAAQELAARYRALERFAAELAASLEAATERAANDQQADTAERVRVAKVERTAGDMESLLDFQERLATLEGVRHVTVAGTSKGQATFLVELESDAGPHKEVCARCGTVLAEGIEPPTHGLCERCRPFFGR